MLKSDNKKIMRELFKQRKTIRRGEWFTLEYVV